ncbi:MAG: hypothetical protein JW888_01960 [Pirellulales bacterium]|nr:hypothetical protein [Pirellulales bacterium]
MRRAMDEAEKNDTRPVLIFQFEVPPGQEDFGRGSQFGASLDVATFLSSDALSGATTVAYIPRSIQGHAVLVALACDEIIMASDATIGSAGIDSPRIDDAMRGGYREIALRRRTVPVELALGMLDPAHEVHDVDTEMSNHEFVTPEQLEELRKHHRIKNDRVVIRPGEVGQFRGDRARQLGFVSYLAQNRREAAGALELPPEQVEEDILLADKWIAVRVDLEGLVTFEKVNQVKRSIEEAIGRDAANFVCLWIDSAGGSPTDSINLANFLADLPSTKVRTVAYIDNKARGDAALVALACDQIVMLPDAVLGGPGDYFMSAPEIDQAKDGIRQRARQKFRSWSLPMAMFDPNLTVFCCTRLNMPGLKEYFCTEELDEENHGQPDGKKQWRQGQPVHGPGRLYQANGAEAVDHHLANHTVKNFTEFKEIYGLEDDPHLVEPNWADSLIRILASPAVAMLLLMVGGAALYAELHTPGIGLGGFLATVCFLMFFWAQFIGDNAVWLEIILFLAGVSFLVLEVFVLPGFGIFGIGGGALVLASLVLATQTFFLPRNEYQLHQFQVSLTIVAGAGLGVVVLASMLNRWLPHVPLLNRLMLGPPTAEEQELTQHRESLVHFEELLGQQGITTTQLTPSGKARFGDQLVDVIADGELVEPNTRIVVVEIHGNRVMVEPVDAEE